MYSIVVGGSLKKFLYSTVVLYCTALGCTVCMDDVGTWGEDTSFVWIA
jgi:hypothetical protein